MFEKMSQAMQRKTQGETNEWIIYRTQGWCITPDHMRENKLALIYYQLATEGETVNIYVG